MNRLYDNLKKMYLIKKIFSKTDGKFNNFLYSVLVSTFYSADAVTMQ